MKHHASSSSSSSASSSSSRRSHLRLSPVPEHEPARATFFVAATSYSRYDRPMDGSRQESNDETTSLLQSPPSLSSSSLSSSYSSHSAVPSHVAAAPAAASRYGSDAAVIDFEDYGVARPRHWRHGNGGGRICHVDMEMEEGECTYEEPSARSARRRKTIVMLLSASIAVLVAVVDVVAIFGRTSRGGAKKGEARGRRGGGGGGVGKGHGGMALDEQILGCQHAPHQSHDHTVPTLLGVRHEDDGRYVNALKSSVYDDMRSATYQHGEGEALRRYEMYGKTLRSSPSTEDGDSASAPVGLSGGHYRIPSAPATRATKHKPVLTVDRDSVSFHEPLSVLWSKKGVHKKDVIALYCPHDVSDPSDFRDAARIEDARRTTMHVLGEFVESEPNPDDHDDAEGGDDDDGNDEKKEEEMEKEIKSESKNIWMISHFPIVREETCEFRLWRRKKSEEKEEGEEEEAEEEEKEKEVKTGEKKGEGQLSTLTGGGDGDANDDDDSKTQFTLVASTGPFYVRHGRTQPTGLHLALSSDPSEMVVHFVTGVDGVPVAQYGISHDKLENVAWGESVTYGADDLCQSPANITEPGKFIHPGQLHAVTMTGLVPDAVYYYRVGVGKQRPDSRASDETHKAGSMAVEAVDAVARWSVVGTFRSPPATGTLGEGSSGGDKNVAAENDDDDGPRPYTYAVYADQGAPGYGSMDGSERVTRWTTREVDEHGIRAVHHFGDLAYANGAGHMWDAWMDMVSTFASRVPLMIGVGNHEYDHTGGGEEGKDPSGLLSPDGYQPEWGNFGHDSGGECGVPAARRFRMPGGGNGVFWYGYDHGLVHTVMLSSEHDLSPGSEQHLWLERELSSVDRTLTPFLVIESHRPLYNSEDIPANTLVSLHMRESIEDMLVQYGVDLFLAGHYHAYLRTCEGLYRSKCNNGGPVAHITVGSAGAELDKYPLYDQDWTESFLREWGYGRITVFNATHLKFEFVADEEGEVKDEVWVIKEQ